MINNVGLHTPTVSTSFATDAEITKFAALLIIHKSLQASLWQNTAILDEAKKSAYSIDEDSEARVEALRNLASALARAGRHYEAKQVLKDLKDSPVVKAKELREIAEILVCAGSIYASEAASVLNEANIAALQIKHKPTQIKALQELKLLFNNFSK
jgi:glycine/D-amino acid oxidase-like deaminating enzyme